MATKKARAAAEPKPAGILAAILRLPERCPSCGSASMAIIPDHPPIEDMTLVGTLENGVAYAGVVWQDARCDCGQFVRLRSYLPPRDNA